MMMMIMVKNDDDDDGDNDANENADDDDDDDDDNDDDGNDDNDDDDCVHSDDVKGKIRIEKEKKGEDMYGEEPSRNAYSAKSKGGVDHGWYHNYLTKNLVGEIQSKKTM